MLKPTSIRRHAALVAVALSLLAVGHPALARKKPCPIPDGVRCASLAEVYALTNDRDSLESVGEARTTTREEAKPEPAKPAARAATGRIAYRPVKHADAVANGDTLEVRLAAPAQTITPAFPTYTSVVTGVEPVRAPAKVMRILVMEWEDAAGSLHMPGTIFTEIEPKRWSVGQPATQQAEGFSLLEGLGSPAAKDSQASASSASAPAALPSK